MDLNPLLLSASRTDHPHRVFFWILTERMKPPKLIIQSEVLNFPSKHSTEIAHYDVLDMHKDFECFQRAH